MTPKIYRCGKFEGVVEEFGGEVGELVDETLIVSWVIWNSVLPCGIALCSSVILHPVLSELSGLRQQVRLHAEQGNTLKDTCGYCVLLIDIGHWN